MFIKIEANLDGSHAVQIGGSLEHGWAFWDTDAVAVPKSFPFVDIGTELVTHPAVTEVRENLVDGETVEEVVVIIPEYTQLEVISASACEVHEEPEPENEQTAEERISALEQENKVLKAQLELQEQKQTFLEDCLLEMGDAVYA